jgi:hypothetical protein
MKKRTIVPLIAFNVLVLLVLAGLFVLTEAYPLRPGISVYSIQHTAEQWRMQLTAGQARRATMALELAERRLADLAQAGERGEVNAAAVAFDRALGEAVRQVEVSQQPEQSELSRSLAALLDRAEFVLAGLEPFGDDVVLATLQRQVLAMQETRAPVGAVVFVTAPEPIELPQAAPIPFLGQDIDHTIWPLTGGHNGLECEDCHQQGFYAGTPGECEDCHQIPDSDLYPEHFAGECVECHLVDSWDPSDWDHAEIIDCQSCHEDESPQEHYVQGNDNAWLLLALSNRRAMPKQGSLLDQRHYDRCADCHTSTDDWEEFEFDHFGFTDCQSCHALESELGDHYGGQCSICHTTDDWEPLAFEHANVDECRSCHVADSPAAHYVRADSFLWYTSWAGEESGRQAPGLFSVQRTPATCANCHTDTEDWTGIEFDHTGFDGCESCHPREGDLENHYVGQCSNCHIVDTWEEVSFDHTGYTDCQDCHTLEEAHYPGQCSQCHTVDDWEEVSFSHKGFAACSSCHKWETPGGHYPGPCTLCHTTNEWSENIYEHSRKDDCRSCHIADFDHYNEQCSLCHNTETWQEAIQPHSGMLGCGLCHTAPPAHYGRACLNCHTTETWEEVDFDHTGFADCRACHEGPEQHYPAQCSACHNNENWENYFVNHVELGSCFSCHMPPQAHWPGECSTCHDSQTWNNIAYTHYTGSNCVGCHPAPADHWPAQCSTCHNMTNWSQVTIDHNVLTDCLSCHPTPDGHWPGQCSSCHGTSNWANYVFNHDGYDNCKACHSGERPINHERGQCSKCHSTSGWGVVYTPTPTPEPDPTQEPEATPGTDSTIP